MSALFFDMEKVFSCDFAGRDESGRSVAEEHRWLSEAVNCTMAVLTVLGYSRSGIVRIKEKAYLAYQSNTSNKTEVHFIFGKKMCNRIFFPAAHHDAPSAYIASMLPEG